MRLVVCTPTLKRYDCCVEMIKSACQSARMPDLIAVIDNGMTFAEHLERVTGEGYFAGLAGVEVEIVTPDENLGVAGSWNVFLRSLEPDDLAIIVNDDIEFQQDTLARFEAAYRANPDAALFLLANEDVNAFSCFAATTKTVEQIGLFDELFWPAYFEDNDYIRRALLKGVKIVKIEAEVRHVGSATLQAFTAEEKALHHQRFRDNQSRYLRKWGGPPNQEVYETEFGQ